MIHWLIIRLWFGDFAKVREEYGDVSRKRSVARTEVRSLKKEVTKLCMQRNALRKRIQVQHSKLKQENENND